MKAGLFRIQCRRGAAAVELAAALPILILSLFGACDFGRFAYTQVAVANAARAGASQGQMNRPTPTTQAPWEAAIRQAVGNELAEVPGFDEDQLEVNITTITESDAVRFRVQVRYPFSTLVSWRVIPNHVVMQQTVVFRILD